MGVPYRVVVEPQERDAYASVIDPARILVLPFSRPGQPALVESRNWIKEHATAEGHKRHWQLDDNIRYFARLNRNRRFRIRRGGACFRVVEDFADRYENVALAGMEYVMFAPARYHYPPFRLNTRIYSCTLVLNAIPHGWRAVYNDDTDISLRCLKDGWCTVLCIAFLCHKSRTMTVGGGLTPHYQGDKRLEMAKSLYEQHPDVTTIQWRWGRWQHKVDYRPFKHNKLRPVPGLAVPEDPNEYGLTLADFRETKPAES